MKVDLRKTTISGRTLLMGVARRRELAIMEVLLQSLDPKEIKERLDQQDDPGSTALSHAVSLLHYSRSQHAVVRYLLSKHVELNSEDAEGLTPLLHAVRQGYTSIVKWLCRSDGVDRLARDTSGRSLLHLGAGAGNASLFAFLVEHSCLDVDDVDTDGRTPLFYAAQHERATLAHRLLHRYGAAVDARDSNGRNPLSYAAEHNSYRTIDLLLQGRSDCESEDQRGRDPLSYDVAGRHCAATVSARTSREEW